MLAVYAPVSKFRKTDIIPVIGTVFFVCININSPIGLVYLVLVQTLIIVSTASAKKAKKKYPFAICRVVCFAMAAAFMILRAFLENSIFGCTGIIFALMAAISLCNDVICEEGRVPTNLWDGVVYVTYFPIMIAGPFVRYADFTARFDRISFNINAFSDGVVLFMKGFVKCIAVASVMGAAYDDILATAGYGISIFLGVVLSAMYSVKVYIMFSGCSDIGRGISRMLGIKLEKDMGDPFVNPSPVHYLKNFFRGIITFFETCIAAPLTKRFGNSMLVKISASILSSAFMLLLFSVVSDAFVVLVLPLSVAMYSVLFPSEEPEAAETKYKLEKYVLAMLGYVCTFIVMSFAWSFIKVGDLSTVRAYLGVMQNNKMFAVPTKPLRCFVTQDIA
jgi:alginate O-acetyltransferase complex protein AlgI